MPAAPRRDHPAASGERTRPRRRRVPDDKESLPGRWLAIDVAPDGTLKQKPADLAFAFPLVRVFDMRFDLVLNGEPAWFIQRGGEPAGDLVRRGALERMAKDDLVGHVLEEGGALTAHAFAMDCRGDAAGAAP